MRVRVMNPPANRKRNFFNCGCDENFMFSFARRIRARGTFQEFPADVLLGEPVAGGEGCLSFPEIFAEITRPESVDVKALNQKGKPVEFRCGGLLARAIQHEVDHLNGILFIDRMSRETKEELRPELDDLQAKTKAELESAGKR